MANSSNNKEPSNAPLAERWYNLALGSSFKDNSSSKFFTLRYEFKPASIDKNQPGLLHKNKENRVTVEFQNNQPGKPKVTFEGSSEDYKDNDCVLFFDGETLRLERLHRAVKRLRHVRVHGESSSATVMPATTSVGPAIESRSPPLQKTTKVQQPLNKTIARSLPLEVERIDIGEPESPGPKRSRTADYTTGQPNRVSISPEQKNYELENLDVIVDGEDETPNKSNAAAREVNPAFDINIPTQNDTDDEIADVDLSDDEPGKGPNAAEALRAQVNAGGSQISSSSGSSGSSGSGSGSGSSGSGSEGSDDDSASSGGDVDI